MDIDVLDFHHVDPSTKSFNVSAAHANYGIERVREEMAKCVVVCANCHRRIHAGTIDLEDYYEPDDPS